MVFSNKNEMNVHWKNVEALIKKFLNTTKNHRHVASSLAFHSFNVFAE